MNTLPDASQTVFQLTMAARDMVVSDWGDLVAVYQRSSGETHVFNEVTSAFMTSLDDGPGTLETLVRRVAVIVGLTENEAAADEFLQVVLRLEELGLIDRARAGVATA